MCDPATIGGLVLSVAGGAGQAQTQNKYIGAVNQANKDVYAMSQRARDDERVRQKQFEDQSVGVFQNTQDGLTRENFDTNQQETSDAFLSALSERQDNPVVEGLAALPSQDGASVAVKDSIARSASTEAAKTRAQIKAFADLAAFGTTGNARGRDMSAAADKLSTIGGLRAGSMSVANQEQNIRPADVTAGSTAFADILSGIGGILSYGGSNLFGKGANALGAGMNFGKPLQFSAGVMPPIG